MNLEPSPDPAVFAGPATDADLAVRNTRAWVEGAVVGLNLCPFAKPPMVKGLIRYAHCPATDEEALLATLCDELQALVAADPRAIETTLLVHPEVLVEFDAFNDFLDLADAAVESLRLVGVIQVASFHPRYRFAGTDDDDIGNATNRSPYPTLHLLREDSVERAVDAFPHTEAIVEANIRTLQALGAAGWAALEATWRDGRPPVSAPRRRRQRPPSRSPTRSG